MRRILCAAAILTLLLCACGVREAMEDVTEDYEGFEHHVKIASTRPVPDEVLPEIEKNKELLLAAMSIDEDAALRCAEILYSGIGRSKSYIS